MLMGSFTLYRMSKKMQYLISSIIIIAVAGICYLFVDYIGYRSVALVLLFVVSVLAAILDIGPLLLSAFLSALIWDFFFIPPKFLFHVESTEDILLLLMYFVVALVNALLIYRIRKAEKESNEKREKEKTIKLYNTLLNSLSHELRTPIATIVGSTDTLQENNLNLSEENKNTLISEISLAALRLNQQVENLLNIQRLEAGFLQLHKDWCDVNELIYRVVHQIQEKNTKHTFNIQIQEALPYFKLDDGVMEQVLYNILLNAVIYTKPSVIHIKVSKFDFNKMDISEPDNLNVELVIVIRDEGKGFPENEIDKVFDKFYRLQHSKTGGTGLGLSIVKGFVEAHNGTVRLKNNTTGGAEFTIVIPAETTYINALKNE